MDGWKEVALFRKGMGYSGECGRCTEALGWKTAWDGLGGGIATRGVRGRCGGGTIAVGWGENWADGEWPTR